jgi:hypothetical protein
VKTVAYVGHLGLLSPVAAMADVLLHLRADEHAALVTRYVALVRASEEAVLAHELLIEAHEGALLHQLLAQRGVFLGYSGWKKRIRRRRRNRLHTL